MKEERSKQGQPNKAKQHSTPKLGSRIFCVTLPCCLFDLPCLFLPSFSHLSLKHVHAEINTGATG